MTALLAVEWRRGLARRLVRVSVALTVLAILIGATIALLVSREMDQAALARAQAARQIQVQRCIAGQLQGMPTEVPPQERPQFCDQQFIPPVQDRQFHYEILPIILVAMSPFAISLGWLLGASLVGADWHAGTMATLLTWEPRRVRVLLAKLVAAGGLAVTLAVDCSSCSGPRCSRRGCCAGLPRALTRAGCGRFLASVCGWRPSLSLGP